MREDDGSVADTAGRRMAKMSRVEKLASVALVIAGAGSLILLEIYFPNGETPNRLIGALTLVFYLAVFTAITLMVWGCWRRTFSLLRLYGFVSFWFMLAGFVVYVCAWIAFIVFAMIAPPPSFLPKSFTSTFINVVIGALMFTLFAFVAILFQVLWTTRRNLRRWPNSPDL